MIWKRTTFKKYGKYAYLKSQMKYWYAEWTISLFTFSLGKDIGTVGIEPLSCYSLRFTDEQLRRVLLAGLLKQEDSWCVVLEGPLKALPGLVGFCHEILGGWKKEL